MSENQENTPSIILPDDQYAHTGAPTEWWWHVGTLYADDGRTFGFEINAAGMTNNLSAYAFTQIQITDVKNQRNYQRVNVIIPCPPNWAQYDKTQPWFVRLGQSGTDGAVAMSALDGNVLNMSVQATFTDVDPDSGTNTNCELNLNFLQEGPPLLVWGTGCNLVDPSGTSPISRNNYYYSLTNLHASGIIRIGNEEIKVSGLTWMDHEYGAFPNGSTGKVIWLLQDIQLENGLHLSNYTKFGVVPEENVPIPSNATLLVNGESIFLKTITTPLGPTFISRRGIIYFLKFKIEFEDYKHLSFIVNVSYPDQVFRDVDSADVYEGVATAEFLFNMTENKQVVISKGTSWVEQNLG